MNSDSVPEAEVYSLFVCLFFTYFMDASVILFLPMLVLLLLLLLLLVFGVLSALLLVIGYWLQQYHLGKPFGCTQSFALFYNLHRSSHLLLNYRIFGDSAGSNGYLAA